MPSEETRPAPGRPGASGTAALSDHPIHAHLDELRTRLETYIDGGTARAVAEAERETRAHQVDRPKRDPFAPPPRPKPGRSLAELSPAIAAEWYPSKNGGLTPADVANARNASAWWLCSLCGAEWEAVVAQRTRRQTIGCPDCGRARAGAERSRPRPGLKRPGFRSDLLPQGGSDHAPEVHPRVQGPCPEAHRRTRPRRAVLGLGRLHCRGRSPWRDLTAHPAELVEARSRRSGRSPRAQHR
ncbi:zinc-ribbon domain-containing protein [Micrococcus sp. EYE_162]|nr:zinc-ribbon domain-containing protein [Micrococcus sp. EYE_212]MCK6172633.1 zinc-ribbon domain-containing protein [Micrococcus sp. EYE_162]